MLVSRYVVIVVFPLVVVACSSEDKPAAADVLVDLAQDQSLPPDHKIFPDLGAPPDLPPRLPCDSEWREALYPQQAVSTGVVVTHDTGGGIMQTLVDATAGGMRAATQNPFVYVSLLDGRRVDLDDFAARSSTAWDLALRRAVIRVNGGDSGPGQGAVAIRPATTLEQVTAVPPPSNFSAEEYLDDQCVVRRNEIGDIWTAFGGTSGRWYDYDTGTMRVLPKNQAYVVRLANGTHVRLVIDDYYSQSGTSAFYTLRWSPL